MSKFRGNHSSWGNYKMREKSKFCNREQSENADPNPRPAAVTVAPFPSTISSTTSTCSWNRNIFTRRLLQWFRLSKINLLKNPILIRCLKLKGPASTPAEETIKRGTKENCYRSQSENVDPIANATLHFYGDEHILENLQLTRSISNPSPSRASERKPLIEILPLDQQGRCRKTSCRT